MSLKLDNTQVTNVDIEVEKKLIELINKKFNSHQIISEELLNKNKEINSEFKWVIDPIDGTKAFIHGKPTFGTLIALYRENIPIIGIIDQPILKERWIGTKGKTTYNNKIVKSSNKSDLSDVALEATSPLMFSEESYKKFLLIAKQVNSISWGSDCYAYGMMASGFVDIICEEGLKYWDYSAILPIINGSGGIISDWEGNALKQNSNGRVLACSNQKIHEKVLEILNN